MATSTGRGRGRGRACIPGWTAPTSGGTITPTSQRSPGGLSSSSNSSTPSVPLPPAVIKAQPPISAAQTVPPVDLTESIGSLNISVSSVEEMSGSTHEISNSSKPLNRTDSTRSLSSSESGGPSRSASQSNVKVQRMPVRSPLAQSPLSTSRPSTVCQPVALPSRPDFGRQGDRIPLVTNHFEIKMPKEVTFFHYDMQIIEQHTPYGPVEWSGGRVPKHTRDEMRELSYKVFFEWARKFSSEDFFAFIYDRQKHVYSCVFFGREQVDDKITVNSRTFKVRLTQNIESPQIKVSMEEIKRTICDEGVERDRSPMQILDLLHNQMLYFKRCLGKTDYTPHGRCFYKDDPQKMIPLPMGRQLRDGFIKSLRLVNGTNKNLQNPAFTITMNIDAKMSPFFTCQRLDKTASDILNLRSLDKDGLKHFQIDLLRTHFKELRVKTIHNNRIFTITNVSDQPAYKETFPKDGRVVTVEKHFEEMNQPLQFPALPCVKDEQKHFIPMEKCFVLPNQKVDLRKLTADQSSIIIKKSAVAPDVRRQKIMEKSEELSGGNDDFLNKLGLQRDKQMMKVEGRVLKPPPVIYGNNQTVMVRAGSWQISGLKLLHGATVKNYLLICLDENGIINNQLIMSFNDALVRKAQQMGMKIPNKFVDGNYKKVDEVLTYVDEYKISHNVDLAICILDDKKGTKQRGDLKYTEKETEVIMACLAAKTLKKFAERPQGNDMLMENIVLKLNSKCGGLNNEIVSRDPVTAKWMTKETMFIGLDVNHPPALSKKEIAMGCVPKKPSVVGAVANAGARASDYFMQAKAQDARREAITNDNMTSIMKRFLTSFEANKGNLPKNIVVYRDGVSESQFAMVLNEETLAIKSSFSQVKPGYNPKLTVLTVQKRHNTRFFRDDNVRMNERAKNADKNIPAGTVVDTGPVGAFQFDFFLASHAGIQGCTKASNYVVLYDENKFLADELQYLTYALCHVYQRSTKSVSLAAPCYFAHHAATRGKELVDGFLFINDDASSGVSSLSSGSDRPLFDFDEINKKIAYSDDFGNRALFL